MSISKQPLVSVIVPLFNNQDFVADCIVSILKQSYQNIEVIVIDDGCTDNSLPVLAPYKDKLRIIHQANQGSAVARNHGIKVAKGELIAFNDADDLWTPYKLETQVAFLLANPQYKVVCGIDERVQQDFNAKHIAQDIKPPIALVDKYSGDQYLTLFSHCPFHINNLMVKAEVLSNIAFDPNLRRGQDLDLWFQISHRFNIAYLNQLFSYYRDNSQSISYKLQTKNVKLGILNNALARFGNKDRSNKQLSSAQIQAIRANIHNDYAYSHRLFQKPSTAFLHYFKALTCRPFNLKTYLGIFAAALELLRIKKSPSLEAISQQTSIKNASQ